MQLAYCKDSIKETCQHCQVRSLLKHEKIIWAKVQETVKSVVIQYSTY